MFEWLRKLIGAEDRSRVQPRRATEPVRRGDRPPSQRQHSSDRSTLNSAAPPEAQLAREFFNTISGVTYTNADGTHRQSIIKREVRSGMRLSIRFEDDNPVDTNAVALLTPSCHQIGYLNQRTAEEVRDYIGKGQWVEIRVSATTGATADKPTCGVNILVKVFAIPIEIPVRTVDFRKAVADARHEGREDQAEEWLLEDVAKREKQGEIYNAVVSSWPYEQLANLYRHQRRQADEIAILERYFALPSSRRLTLSDKLQQRLDKALSQSKAAPDLRTRKAQFFQPPSFGA